MMKSIKLVIVGDGAVGKSCLLISYTTKSFPNAYVPTVFDNYVSTINVNGTPYNIGFWDTAGQEDYDRLRPLSYPGTDIFLIAFAVNSRTSFENVKEKWVSEIKHFTDTCNPPPIYLVGCKSDLRDNHADSKDFVSKDEAVEYACKELGSLYFETSALTQDGLNELFNKVVEMHDMRPRFLKFKGKKKYQKEALLPPVMPPAGKAPYIEIETSTFSEQWLRVLQNAQHADVIFLLEGGRHRVSAHKVLLCSASSFFLKVFGINFHCEQNQLKAIKTGDRFDEIDLKNGRIPGIATVCETSTIEISQDIKSKHFIHVLEYLYSGQPQLGEDTTDEDLEDIINLSHIFNLPFLKATCENIKNGDEFLNPSIGTYLSDETGKRMKELFFKQKELSDVTFIVGEEEIPCHRAVLSTRSDVFGAMLNGNFQEGENNRIVICIADHPLESLYALLEYLYTDHAPIDKCDPISIMSLADQYVQSRLVNLCELEITKVVDKLCCKNIETAPIDVIGILLNAEMVNAKQLLEWCLHFISTNYAPFSARPEFDNLGNHREFVEENRWPPVSYLKEVEEYEKKVSMAKSKGDRCNVM